MLLVHAHLEELIVVLVSDFMGIDVASISSPFVTCLACC